MTPPDGSPAVTIAREFSPFAADAKNPIGKLCERLRLGERSVKIAGLAGGAAFLVACLVRQNLNRRLLYITPSAEKAEIARNAAGFFTGENPPDAAGGFSFASRAKNCPIICASVRDVCAKIASPDFLSTVSLRVKTGDETDRDDFLRDLLRAGYIKKEFARLAGEMSVRGAIVDIISAGSEPLRVEFSGDKIRSLRRFDARAQMSVSRAESAEIFPVCVNEEISGDNFVSVADLCGRDPVVFCETEKLEDLAGIFKNSESENKNPSAEDAYFPAPEIWQKLSKFQTVSVQRLGGQQTIDFQTKALKPQTDNNEPAAGKILKAAQPLESQGWNLKIFTRSENETQQMREIFGPQTGGRTRFCTAASGGGFVFPDIGAAFIDTRDFAEKIPAAKTGSESAEGKFPASKFSAAFKDIKEGDFIIHREFGIGIFRGLKNLKIRKTKGDFIECEYHGGDSVYVPVSNFRLLHPYVGDGSEPKIDRLGAAEWKKKVRGAQAGAEKTAREILELYARRKSAVGHRFSKPAAEFREFEMDFMFEETPDQKKAIDDVMKDMRSPRPMDRLICGDTGFGKTEVALRAALTAAMDGFQTALIAPTTLLVKQHIETARKRLEKFPVRVFGLSRFNSPGTEKRILSEIERGTADIIIGTHKLLGSKIRFKNLGLLIIDEEHRFGVRHKEKLKGLKKNLDALSLSATPIPRTLQLSLAGIRDISVINSPPRGRLPVKISAQRWDGALIRRLALREKKRGGGVFFIHNRIETIEPLARRLRSLLPEISIETTHGKMPKKDLEARIENFAEGKTDMLAATAIVESGLDITRANTIIINDAHTFGVADLYQLKGRVGRGSRQAFACLLLPEGKPLAADAWKRLERFCELSDFGGGYELAFSDLRMRGAGSLFGLEQSGHIAGVGTEFYLDMLTAAVERLRSGKSEREFEPEIKTKIPSLIPADFVKNSGERLVFYRRISSSSTAAEISRIRKELRDRFGKIPQPLKNLLAFAAIRNFLKKNSAEFCEITGGRMSVFSAKNRSGNSMIFAKSGKKWKALSCSGFAEKTAKKFTELAARLTGC